jgi:protocatechuate 3,4-dioxygenase beta subunit
MKHLLTLATVILIAGIALAGPGGIAGMVLDNHAGSPIPNALVVAKGEYGQTGQAHSDDRGHYEISGLRPGNYRVGAEARGHERGIYPQPVEVEPDQVVRDINFRLRPLNSQTGAIAGQVTDRRTGEPVRKGLVVAVGENGRGKARTDKQGYYVIRGLPPGAYRVGAKANHYVGAEHPRPVRVEAGQVTRDIDFRLEPEPMKGAIVGRVVDARTGKPIAGALVQAAGEHGRGQALTDRDGWYRIGRLDPGLYRVTAHARGHESATFPRPVPVRPGATTRGVDFRLHRNITEDK